MNSRTWSGREKVGGGSEGRFKGRASFAIVWLKVKQVTKGVGWVFKLEEGETKMRLETSGEVSSCQGRSTVSSGVGQRD